MYLKPNLRLNEKRLQRFDIYISKAYYAVTKKGVVKALNKALSIETNLDFLQTKEISAKKKTRKQERIEYWNKTKLITKPKKRVKVRAVNKEYKQKACLICQFILDNFETLQRNKRSFYVKTWANKNPDKVNTKSKVSGKKRKLRVPRWLTKEQKDYMDAVHMEAKALRKGGLNVHVDHIIPLCGDNISGLHVPENLEIVPALDNLLKNNNWELA